MVAQDVINFKKYKKYKFFILYNKKWIANIIVNINVVMAPGDPGQPLEKEGKDEKMAQQEFRSYRSC